MHGRVSPIRDCIKKMHEPRGKTSSSGSVHFFGRFFYAAQNRRSIRALSDLFSVVPIDRRCTNHGEVKGEVTSQLSPFSPPLVTCASIFGQNRRYRSHNIGYPHPPNCPFCPLLLHIFGRFVWISTINCPEIYRRFFKLLT